MTNETRITSVLIEGDPYINYRLLRLQDVIFCQSFCAYCDAYLKEAFYGPAPAYVQYHDLIVSVRDAFKTEIDLILHDTGKSDEFTLAWAVRRYDLFIERETYRVLVDFSWGHTIMTHEADFDYCSGSVGRAYVDSHAMFCFIEPDDAILFKLRN